MIPTAIAPEPAKTDPFLPGQQPSAARSGMLYCAEMMQGDTFGAATSAFRIFGEAVKQWTDVLGLGIEPVATDAGTPSAAWTRYRHADAAGVVKLEAYRGEGEPHNFELPAAAVIRFFGLDQPGAESG